MGWLVCACLSLSLLNLAGCTDGGNGGAPTSASLISLEITPASPGVVAGTSVQLTATGIYSDNTHLDVTSAVSWTSTNTAIGSRKLVFQQYRYRDHRFEWPRDRTHLSRHWQHNHH